MSSFSFPSPEIRAYQVSAGFYPHWGQDKKIIGCYANERLAASVSSLCLELFHNQIKGNVDHFCDPYLTKEIPSKNGWVYTLNGQAAPLETTFDQKKISSRVRELISGAGDLKIIGQEKKWTIPLHLRPTVYQVSVGFYPGWGFNKKVIGCYVNEALAKRVSSLCLTLFHGRTPWGSDHYLDRLTTRGIPNLHGYLYDSNLKPALFETEFNPRKIVDRVDSLIEETNPLESDRHEAMLIVQKSQKKTVETDSDSDEPSQSIFSCKRGFDSKESGPILEFLKRHNRPESEGKTPSESP